MAPITKSAVCVGSFGLSCTDPSGRPQKTAGSQLDRVVAMAISRHLVVARVLAALSVGPMVSASASAAPPGLDVRQFAHAAWTARQGFFDGVVRAIVQTQDGYLWLGTELGLVRF